MMPKEQPIWTRSFLSLFMATLLVFTAFYLLLPTLPLYLIKNLKVGTGYTGIALAAYTVAALIIRPVTGFMIDLNGRKWIYLASLLIFSLLFGGYVFAVTLAGKILWGITTTTGNTIAVDLVPPMRRGEGLGYFGLSGTIPMAIGPMIGLWLVSGGNYSRMFLVSVFLSFVGFVFAMGIRHPKIALHKTPFSFRNLIERSTLPVALVLLLSMISYGGLVSFLSLYVKETGIGDAGFFFLIYASGIALSRLLSGRIFDRQGPRKLTVAALGLLILGFLVLSCIHILAGFYGSAFLLGIGNGVISPTLQTMANNMVEPRRRGAANSTLFTGLDLGIGIGMMLTGFLAGTTGLSNAFLVFCVLNGLALSIFLTYSHSHYNLHRIK